MSDLPKHPLQAMVDGMTSAWQKERAEKHMTLGELIDALEAVPTDFLTAGFGWLCSYRGYYADLAFVRDDKERSAGDLLTECRAAMGEVFHGYKGGEYVMGRRTPLWVVDDYGATGDALTTIQIDGPALRPLTVSEGESDAP